MAALSATGWRLLLPAMLLIALSFAGGTSTSRQRREVQKHLNRLNKKPLKSIKSADGDIIDCVAMFKQPAFDHPLLRDHEIQMKPAFHPEGLSGEAKVSSVEEEKKIGHISQLWHKNGRCPDGTVPIRRTKRDDIQRSISPKLYGKKRNRHRRAPMAEPADVNWVSQSGHQHAIAYVKGLCKGAKASINVWQPTPPQSNLFSLSQIWVLGGSFEDGLNSIEAGWQVSPDLYGDNNTRLFSYWTSDAYQATGCYNLLCSGFIQVNSHIAMGATISPVSYYEQGQYDITILVWKDIKDGHWWLGFGKDNVMGYWPSFLFSYLAESASVIEWGGEVVNSQLNGVPQAYTPMGSGHFPEEGFGKASYFRNIYTVDASNNLRYPKDLGLFMENSDCYRVKNGENEVWGTYFYYGGPGC